MSRTGELTINGKDAYTEWRAFFGNGSVNALMKPTTAKPLVSNASRLQNGKRVIRTTSTGNNLRRVADRDVSLIIHISAKDHASLMTYHAALIQELQAGVTVLRTAHLPGWVFHLDFISCTEFSQLRGLGKYVIKFNEPNPADRT